MIERTLKDLVIRRINENDLEAAARVHAAAFPRQTFSLDWITCAFRAFPKIQMFVAEQNLEIIGLVFWTEKSGFRPQAIAELEQIAVHPTKQGQGVGTALIQRSLPLVAAKIEERGAKLSHLLVNTRADNHAQLLYEKAMGAKAVATIAGMFVTEEVYMIARDVEINSSAEIFKPDDIQAN